MSTYGFAGRVFDPCPKCGGELNVDGDGFEYCLHCSYHEADQGSGAWDESEADGSGRDISGGFDFASDDDVDDDGRSRMAVFEA